MVLPLSLSRGIAGEVQRAYQLTCWRCWPAHCRVWSRSRLQKRRSVCSPSPRCSARAAKHFDRHAYPLLSRRNLLWLAALAAPR
ncbi:MAG: hypothetical protein IPN63_06480 [Gammaproteobacteria bacterium]|nr:hypothetical protein [Gammaproteobacteria bacterium]